MKYASSYYVNHEQRAKAKLEETVRCEMESRRMLRDDTVFLPGKIASVTQRARRAIAALKDMKHITG